MERVRPLVVVLSALLLAAVGARDRLRRRSAGDPPASTGPEAPGSAAPADGAAATTEETSGAPWAVARLDRGLAVLGTVGFLATLGLAVWEVAGIGPALAPAGGLDWPFVALLATLIVWAVYLFWKVPQWQAGGRRGAGPDAKDRFEVENSARGTLGQMLSGVAVIAGLLFAWQQLGSTSETLRVSEEGQITERFTRAVDQLGSDDATIRLGGIYALERIARDSARDEGPVAEVLAAYVREHAAAGAAGTPAPSAAGGVAVDVRAVLEVLTADDAPRNATACVDLSGTDLTGVALPNADLRGACLDGVVLVGATLTGADLGGATLNRADLAGANLDGAGLEDAELTSSVLSGANLSAARASRANLLSADARGAILDRATLAEADLNGANLDGALLFDADLSEAILTGADLTNAALSGADLSGAVGLTREQIGASVIDGRTRLPDLPSATPGATPGG